MIENYANMKRFLLYFFGGMCENANTPKTLAGDGGTRTFYDGWLQTSPALFYPTIQSKD